MKNVVITLILFVLFKSILIYGQKNNDTPAEPSSDKNKEDTEQVKKLPEQNKSKEDSLHDSIKKLNELLEKIEKDTVEKEKLGDLFLTSDSVIIYNFAVSLLPDSLQDRVVEDTIRFLKKSYMEGDYSKFIYGSKNVVNATIKEVTIKVENAAIYDIKVKTNANLDFVNRHNIIPLTNWGKRNRNYKLHLSSASSAIGNLEAYINIDDFLDYHILKRYKMDDTYEPISLTLKKPSYQISMGRKFDHLLNLRIYSDLLALLNTSENGLIQFEGDAKFFINMVPCKQFYFLNYVQPFVHVSKFDSESKFVTITENTYNSKTNVEFIQKSNVYSGVTANLVSYVLNDLNTNIDINFGGGFFYAPYKLDTVEQDDKLSGVNYYATIKFVTRRVGNFAFDFGYSFLFTKPFEKDILEYDYGKHDKRTYYYNRMVAGEIQYKFDKKNEIFVRARYVSAKDNAFNQVQIGYRTQIPIPSLKK